MTEGYQGSAMPQFPGLGQPVGDSVQTGPATGGPLSGPLTGPLAGPLGGSIVEPSTASLPGSEWSRLCTATFVSVRAQHDSLPRSRVEA